MTNGALCQVCACMKWLCHVRLWDEVIFCVKQSLQFIHGFSVFSYITFSFNPFTSPPQRVTCVNVSRSRCWFSSRGHPALTVIWVRSGPVLNMWASWCNVPPTALCLCLCSNVWQVGISHLVILRFQSQVTYVTVFFLFLFFFWKQRNKKCRGVVPNLIKCGMDPFLQRVFSDLYIFLSFRESPVIHICKASSFLSWALRF